MTNNQHWLFLEELRRSGAINMFGAAPYIKEAFGVSSREARNILADWMENYDPKNYEDMEWP